MTAWTHKDFFTAEFVFIHHDAHQKSLCPSYDGLFCALEAGLKTFLVDIGCRPEQVLVDRLKIFKFLSLLSCFSVTYVL